MENISVGILSFKAYNTIDKSLNQNINFFRNFGETKLFFQTFSEKDREIAEKYKINYLKRDDNIGIQNGMRWVVENLIKDYILYLENDFVISILEQEAIKIIEKSLNLIKNNIVDMVRLRSKFNPGSPFEDVVKYTKIFKPINIHPSFKNFSEIQKNSIFTKYLRPLKARRISVRSVYIEKEPEKVCKYVKKYDENFYIIDSSMLNWTNNPTLISKKLFLELFDYADKHPKSRTVNGFQDLEKPLNCRWWREKHFKIAICDGIFTHNRLDR